MYFDDLDQFQNELSFFIEWQKIGSKYDVLPYGFLQTRDMEDIINTATLRKFQLIRNFTNAASYTIGTIESGFQFLFSFFLQ